jgi:acylphosphatase
MCAREARAHEVAGWVRNREDGAVEAVFEGATAPVLAMVEWMRRGPELALVERAEVLVEPPAGEASFRVLG